MAPWTRLKRYQELSTVLSAFKARPASALREKLEEGYGLGDLRADVLSGLVVGLVAIPLGMALAIATGVAPQFGLYTVIVAGAVVALLGGSRYQVSGPTAAFVVILAPIVSQHGLAGLLIAGFMAGVILVLMGLARMGQLIQFIPHPVTTGFTSGIGVVIATIQFKDFFGLRVPGAPESFLSRIKAYFDARRTASITEFCVAISTLALLVYWPKLKASWSKKIPAPLVALMAVTVAVALLKSLDPGLSIATVGTQFAGGIPQTLPHFGMPWSFGAVDGKPFQLTIEAFETLVPSAIAIAMLAAIESLLSAVVADGLGRTTHDPDSELLALGVGNMLCPFFGGIAATGAIARTATNIRYGARSPISAVVHSVFVLAVVLLFASYVSLVPMAALAALLVLVAYNMADAKHFVHVLRVAPRSDVTVLLTCFTLTVLFDMVIGVAVGFTLAALMFLRRMAVLTEGKILGGGPGGAATTVGVLPREMLLYEIAGPLFFGAARKALETLSTIHHDVRVIIFDLDRVPMMDMTGVTALGSAIENIASQGRQVILMKVHGQPLEVIERAELTLSDRVWVAHDLDEAVRIAQSRLNQSGVARVTSTITG